jgi:hypothetical protein
LNRRAAIVPNLRDRWPLEAGALDVYRWENDGGAAAIVVA